MCGCVSCRTIKAKKHAEPKASSERVALRDRKKRKDTGGEGEGEPAPSMGKKKKGRKADVVEEEASAPKKRAKKSKK